MNGRGRYHPRVAPLGKHGASARHSALSPLPSIELRELLSGFQRHRW